MLTPEKESHCYCKMWVLRTAQSTIDPGQQAAFSAAQSSVPASAAAASLATSNTLDMDPAGGGGGGGCSAAHLCLHYFLGLLLTCL